MFETMSTEQTKAVNAIDISGTVINSNLPEIKQDQEATSKVQQEPPETVKKFQEVSEAKIESIAQAMDNYVRSIQRDLKIRVHNDTGNIIVEVISGEDGKVIRQIPSENLLNLAAKMEEMTGVLFNENA
jgi:flagellar protein FlaG